MTNGHGRPKFVPNGISNGATNGVLNGKPNGMTNGHGLHSGYGSISGSAGNSSSSGTRNSISPPAITISEQKMLGNGHFTTQNLPTVQQRRRTVGDRYAAGKSAPPVLAEEQVATRWNTPGTDTSYEHQAARRNSNIPAFSNSPRAASPEYKRSYSPVSILRSPMNGTNGYGTGAMSPVSTLRNEGIILRSQSPLSHEVTSAEISRTHSPARGVGNIARNGNAFATQQQEFKDRQTALAALQGHSSQPAGPHISTVSKSQSQKSKHRLSLQTQIPAHQTPVVPEEEEMEDVISMSPAVREPITSFRRSRSSLALSSLPGASSSQVNLSGMSLTSDPNRSSRYYGQMIDSHDLVANGIENAFSRL